MHSEFVSFFRAQAARYTDTRSCTYLREDGRNLTEEVVTYEQLDRDARAIAAWLAQQSQAARPVLLLYLDGVDFLRAFLGCLYAGVVAVPSPLPHDARSTRRIAAMIEDIDAGLVLTTAAFTGLVAGYLEENGIHEVSCVATDAAPLGDPDQWVMPAISAKSVAFLQFTSGSTSEPKGVVVTHGNLMHNAAAIVAAMDGHDTDTAGGWLPHFHDMGLIGMLLTTLYCGANLVFMSPLAFLKRPFRWLHMIHHYRVSFTVAPNFAYDLAARRTTDEQIATLDLSCLRVALNGAEPIRSQTLAVLHERLRPAGWRDVAMLAAYGMAESTLMVTATRPGERIALIDVDAAALEQGAIVPAQGPDAGARRLVSCGRAAGGMDVRIVDPVTLRELPDNRVGEIWIRGGSVAAGYWNRPEESATKFGAHLAGTARAGASIDEAGPYLRSGDLGVRRGEEFFITGRLKDLLIVNGRNLYPQDIEEVVRDVHPALAESPGVVLAVDAGGGERIVVIHAIKPEQMGGASLLEVASQIKGVVSRAFAVAAPSVVLVERHGVHRTTSGKVQRNSMRASFLCNQIDALLHEDIDPALLTLRTAA